MSQQNSSTKYPLPSHDVSRFLSRLVLTELRKKPLQDRFDIAYWERLKSVAPHLSDYITIASFEAAPDNPILRDELAAAMTGIVILLTEHEASETIAKQWRGYVLEQGNGYMPSNPSDVVDDDA